MEKEEEGKGEMKSGRRERRNEKGKNGKGMM